MKFEREDLLKLYIRSLWINVSKHEMTQRKWIVKIMKLEWFYVHLSLHRNWTISYLSKLFPLSSDISEHQTATGGFTCLHSPKSQSLLCNYPAILKMHRWEHKDAKTRFSSEWEKQVWKLTHYFAKHLFTWPAKLWKHTKHCSIMYLHLKTPIQ